jgi:MATE family multidrug resistance protein
MEKFRTSNHQIWDITWPAILSNISIPLLGLVDTAILGHLGTTQYRPAVAIGGTVLSFFLLGLQFFALFHGPLFAVFTDLETARELIRRDQW